LKQKVARGGLLKYSVVVSNKNPKTSVEGLGFKVVLPTGVTVYKSSVFPSSYVDSGKNKRKVPAARVNGSTLDWVNIPFVAGKKSYRFTVHVRVNNNAPSQLVFTSLAYQSALGDLPECKVYAPSRTVRSSISKRNETKT
jgi:hypothetical protein